MIYLLNYNKCTAIDMGSTNSHNILISKPNKTYIGLKIEFIMLVWKPYSVNDIEMLKKSSKAIRIPPELQSFSNNLEIQLKTHK